MIYYEPRRSFFPSFALPKTLLAATRQARYDRAMDDDDDTLRITIEVAPDRIMIACNDKSYATSAVLAELRNAVEMLQLQVDRYRQMH